MDEELIKRWNEVVKKGDIVYHLGDFAFDNIQQFRERLKGQIHLIKGNHDTSSLKLYKSLFVTVSEIKRVKTFKPHIVLNHYAMRTWKGFHGKTWHLYGHSHCTLRELDNLSFDVGVDCWNFYPVSYEQVEEKMEKKKEKMEKKRWKRNVKK
ncbi:MAG: metallophosphoesterase family protein [Acidobacteriota bacterium]|nr:metallophosphoesterase family protein [Acidobacteriota bacterium]